MVKLLVLSLITVKGPIQDLIMLIGECQGLGGLMPLGSHLTSKAEVTPIVVNLILKKNIPLFSIFSLYRFLLLF